MFLTFCLFLVKLPRIYSVFIVFQKQDTHCQTPSSKRVVVSLRVVLYQEVTPAVAMAAVGPTHSAYHLLVHNSFAEYLCGKNIKAEFKCPLAGPGF